jgi:hypothetical protein
VLRSIRAPVSHHIGTAPREWLECVTYWAQ